MTNEEKEKLCVDVAQYKRENFDAGVESEHLKTLLRNEHIDGLLREYSYGSILGVGGSGIVVSIRDSITHSPRALKLSRKSAASAVEDPDNPVNVELELEALALVNHQNITRFYGGFKTPENHYAIVTELVEEPLEIDDWLRKLFADAQPSSRGQAVRRILIKLAGVLHDCSRALRYMHERLELFHMDIKPGNLLVDKRGVAYVTDLGFARPKRKFPPNASVPIGFTFGFHHPRLEEHGKFRQPSTRAKARNKIPASELAPKFDLYAFGRTVLFLLKIVSRSFGEKAHGDYGFQFLHLLATLLLDGRNTETTTSAEGDNFENETACGVRGDLLKLFRFSSFASVDERFDRLLGRVSIEERIEELNPWYQRHLNHGLGFLTLTPRIAAVIGHPTFRRLRGVSQLGLVEEVYSGATHTRYAHTLGVTAMVVKIVCALYHDPENPIMKILMEDRDILALIAAALVHDLGQSDMGHELEELDKETFSHAVIGAKLLKDKNSKDEKGRTLKDIIVGGNDDEWNVDFEEVVGIIGGRPQPRFDVFRDILDGPIDADKLDYLQRDGRSANVHYPAGLDIDRFIFSVTALPVEYHASKTSKLRLGVKEKGLPSSEAISFARRQMYRAVYLQHTVRCLKAMLLTACADGLTGLEREVSRAINNEGFASQIISEMFSSHLVGSTPAFDGYVSATVQKKVNKIWASVKSGQAAVALENVDMERTATFFWAYMSDSAKELFRDFGRRRLYKRLSARSLATLKDSEIESVREGLKWGKRLATVRQLEERLLAAVGKALDNRQQGFDSLNVDPKNPLEKFVSKKGSLVVVDIPLRTVDSAGRAPVVLTDIARKSGDFRIDSNSSGMGWIWKEGADRMMREVLTCWVFCDPEFHHFVTTLLDQIMIDRITGDVLGWRTDI